MLGLAKGLGIDGNQKAQRRTLLFGWNFADQYFERVGLAGQAQVPHAHGSLGKFAHGCLGVAVLIGRV